MDRKKQSEKTKKVNEAGKQGADRKHGIRTLLYILQHISISVGAVLFAAVITGSLLYEDMENTDVVISSPDGELERQSEAHLYQLNPLMDQQSSFEDTALFHEILGEKFVDVIRMGALNAQMETDGRYDGRKIIDVTAYNNRYFGTPEEYVTAGYYLEDLINWGIQGIGIQDGWVTLEESEAYLSDVTQITKVDYQAVSSDVDQVTFLNTDLQDATTVYDVTGNALQSAGLNLQGEDSYNTVIIEDALTITSGEAGGQQHAYTAEEPYVDEDGRIYITLLDEVYPTAEGQYLKEYVSGWGEYHALSNQVQSAVKDIAGDYRRYENLNARLTAEHSNIRYYIEKVRDGEREFYTNIESDGASAGQIRRAFFDECELYLTYDALQDTFDTNTMIGKETMRQIMGLYQYAYPADTKVWIGVDTDYPADDIFKQGYGRFDQYNPSLFRNMLIGSGVCFLIYLILLAVLTSLTGWSLNGEGKRIIRLHKEDRIPTELMLVLAAFVLLGLIILFNIFDIAFTHVKGDAFIIGYSIGSMLMPLNLYSSMSNGWFVFLCGIYVLLCSLCFSFFYYGFARRIKSGRLWEDSICKKAVGSLQNIARLFHQNPNVMVRVLVPAAALVIADIVLLWYIRRYGTGVSVDAAMVFIVALDLIVGAVLYKAAEARQNIVQGIRKINEGDTRYKVDEKGIHGDNLELARAVNSIGDGISAAVETSMKDERMKADLITNVSHDIKTPLTSIINYIDLIKRENSTDEKIKTYVDILDSKSQRLKQLIDDLVEASKISSGNISLQWESIDLIELIHQTTGEFSEKFEARMLQVNVRADRKHLMISADSRRIWRVMENLFHNVCKYALTGTRVYVDIEESDTHPGHVVLSVKNISEQPLTISADELTERFMRGDVSRSTEGSGLGLSIAKSLTEALNGSFEIRMDGDLFKVVLIFPMLPEE